MKIVRVADGAPLSDIRIAVMSKSGNTLSEGRTDEYGVGYLPVPSESDNPAYVTCDPFPTVMIAVRWFSSVHQYYIEACGGSIP